MAITSFSRSAGALFADACTQFGVDTVQCPLADLERWVEVSRTRYPTAYSETFLPLLRSARATPQSTASAVAPEPGPSLQLTSFRTVASTWLAEIQQRIGPAKRRIHL